MRRVQFTPDLLPSDVTGVSVYNSEDRDFEFKPGPVFANIVVGDEINRASPKTQSALLECMEERQVTVDGVTYPLESPFLVLATQNPIDMEGTYPLPEAQRDRFTARISMGYPDRDAEIMMLNEHAVASTRSTTLRPVSDATEVRALIAAVRTVHVAEAIKAYAVDLAEATRRSSEVRLGASPRATLQLLRTAKAWAALDGRDYVLPDDLQYVLSAGARAPAADDRRRTRRRADRCRRAQPARAQRAGPGATSATARVRLQAVLTVAGSRATVHDPRQLPDRGRHHRRRVRAAARDRRPRARRRARRWRSPCSRRWSCCARRCSWPTGAAPSRRAQVPARPWSST